MSHKTLFVSILVTLLFAVSLSLGGARATLAQSGGTYTLTWSSMDGGGGVSNSGAYSLSGTVGQPDTGALNGGTYTLAGGFWGGGAELARLFLPLLVR
jgi:hypothetical protein